VGRDANGRPVLILGGQPSKYRESFAKRFEEVAKGLETTFQTSPAGAVEPIAA
jgi:hypothetical protein